MSGIDWGGVLAGGIAAGAGAVENQWQQGQQDDEWLKRQQMLQQMELQNAKQKEEYLRSIEPPKTQTAHTMKGDTIMDQGQQWVKDPQTGQYGWQNFGEAVPNANQANLDERERHNRESEGLRQATAEAQASARQAQLGIAEERLNMAAERVKNAAGSRDKGYTFEDYANAPPEQRALYDRFRRGEEDPNNKRDLEARAATLKDLQDVAAPGPDAKPDKQHEYDVLKANTLYQNQTMMGADPFASVKGGAGSTAKPMGQFAAPQKGQAQPSQKSPYPDGTRLKGPDGRMYVVQNGVPVPQ